MGYQVLQQLLRVVQAGDKMKTGFTLIELIIVIIIIGILTTFSVPQYLNVKERAYDKEAMGTLAAIQAAEKNYRIEKGVYYEGSGATDLNTNLKLNLPTTNPSWDYAVAANGNATAQRLFGNGSTGRTWTLLSNGDKATCSGTSCP